MVRYFVLTDCKQIFGPFGSEEQAAEHAKKQIGTMATFTFSTMMQATSAPAAYVREAIIVKAVATVRHLPEITKELE